MEYIINLKSFLQTFTSEGDNIVLANNNSRRTRFSTQTDNSKKIFDQFNDNQTILHSESAESIFLDYGIERDVFVEELGFNRTYNSANNKRIMLELLEKDIDFKGVDIFQKLLSDEKSKEEFFEQVWLLKNHSHFDKIKTSICQESALTWAKFLYSKTDEDAILPLWKIELARFLGKFMRENWGHTFAFVGAFALKSFYSFPLEVKKIDLFVKKEDLEETINYFCKKYDFKLTFSSLKNSAKYALFTLDFSMEDHEIILQEIFPQNKNLTLDSSVFYESFFRAARKTDDNNIPYLCFEHQFKLLKAMIKNNLDSLESIYSLCLLANYKSRYFDEIEEFLREEGIDDFAQIIENEECPILNKNIVVKEFRAVWKKIQDLLIFKVNIARDRLNMPDKEIGRLEKEIAHNKSVLTKLVATYCK